MRFYFVRNKKTYTPVFATENTLIFLVDAHLSKATVNKSELIQRDTPNSLPSEWTSFLSINSLVTQPKHFPPEKRAFLYNGIDVNYQRVQLNC